MTLIQSIALGIIEGLTEFIPVSSTAHMLLAQYVLKIPPSGAMFAYLVLVQLGAIAALLVYFWREFLEMFKAFFAQPFSSPANRMAWLVLIATLPALLAGALLRDATQALFADPLLEAAIRLLSAAALLGLAEWLGRRNRDLATLTAMDAVIVGLFQVLAIFPGASRSGATISGGMLRNLDRPSATRLAFLISAPVMLAAGAYEGAGAVLGGHVGELLPALPLGILVAAVVAWATIRWLLNYVAHHSLYSFAAYCLVVGLISILLRSF